MRECSIQPSTASCAWSARIRRWIALGTFVLASLVHLDGSGAVTFLIVVPAMLPLYERLGMDRRVLAAAAALGAGVMNMLPWGGPTLRAAGALNMSVAKLYRPLASVQVVGMLFAFALCWMLGRRETRRLVRTRGHRRPRTSYVGAHTHRGRARAASARAVCGSTSC